MKHTFEKIYQKNGFENASDFRHKRMSENIVRYFKTDKPMVDADRRNAFSFQSKEILLRYLNRQTGVTTAALVRAIEYALNDEKDSEIIIGLEVENENILSMYRSNLEKFLLNYFDGAPIRFYGHNGSGYYRFCFECMEIGIRERAITIVTNGLAYHRGQTMGFRTGPVLTIMTDAMIDPIEAFDSLSDEAIEYIIINMDEFI